MNPVVALKPQPGPDAFHRARSRCIDAFAGAEQRIVAILRQGGDAPSTSPLGMKIEALRKLKPSPQYTAASKKQVDAHLDALAELLPARADIVHGRLDLVTVDAVAMARFVNAAELCRPFPRATLVTHAQLNELAAKVEAIAAKFT